MDHSLSCLARLHHQWCPTFSLLVGRREHILGDDVHPESPAHQWEWEIQITTPMVPFWIELQYFGFQAFSFPLKYQHFPWRAATFRDTICLAETVFDQNYTTSPRKIHQFLELLLTSVYAVSMKYWGTKTPRNNWEYSNALGHLKSIEKSSVQQVEWAASKYCPPEVTGSERWASVEQKLTSFPYSIHCPYPSSQYQMYSIQTMACKRRTDGAERCHSGTKAHISFR